MKREWIRNKLKGQLWTQRLLYEELDSTNLEAKRYIEEHPDENGVVITSEVQTQGRGRRGRTWVSPAGNGIWMSMILHPKMSLEKAPMLTLVAGMAVRHALAACFQLDSQIKWPNDIIVNDKKICGILTEMRGDGVIVGIGINVGTESFDEELKKIATSVAMETGVSEPDREALLIAVLEAFETYYMTFLETEDLSGLMEEYNRHCINIGRTVRVIEVNREYTAVAEGIQKDGELIVVTTDGEQKQVSSGEVTIRGVMGYAR